MGSEELLMAAPFAEQASLEPNSKAKDLIVTMLKAAKKVGQLESQLGVAVKEHIETQKAVADLLRPSDAKEGEKFHMWFGDSMIEICGEHVYFRIKGVSTTV